MLKNADVNKTEMQLSSSSSKFVSAYCRRKTIAIPGADQESNSANNEMFTVQEEEDVSPEEPPPLENVSPEEPPALEDVSPTKPLLGQDPLLVNTESESSSRKYKLLLFCVILVLGIGVTVGLSIYFTKTREKESVLILSTSGSNSPVPMVINLLATSTGKFHFYIISTRNK